MYRLMWVDKLIVMLTRIVDVTSDVLLICQRVFDSIDV